MAEQKMKIEIIGCEVIQDEPYYLDKELKKLVIDVPEWWEDSVIALIRLPDEEKAD